MVAPLTQACSLEQLRDHAKSRPDHLFKLMSCSECLACDLLNTTMGGYDETTEGAPIPPTFAHATRAFAIAVWTEGLASRERSFATGYALGLAIDRLIAGESPETVGDWLYENRHAKA